MKRKMSWLLVSLAALLLFPAAASADPITITFDEARLQLNNGVVDEEGGTSTFTGDIDTATGDITVPANQVAIAQFETSTGAPVIPQAQTPFTGNYDDETGEFTLGGTVNVVVPTSPTPGGCIFPGLAVEFSTDEEAPSGDFAGSPFTEGLDGDVGSAVTAFQDLPEPVVFGDGDPATCALLDSLADGPGALQIGNDLTPEPPVDPALVANSTPKNAKVKQGKAKTFKVKVRAQDAEGPTQARVCAQVPGGKKGLTVQGGKCKNVNGVYDEAKTVSFKVKAKAKTKPKKYTLRFRATAQGYDSDTATSKLQVQKKKKRRGGRN